MSERSFDEDLLWDLGEDAEDRSGQPVLDSTLEAYRAGQLDDEQSAKIERLLGWNGDARARLIELARLDEVQPPAAVREKLFDTRSVSQSGSSWRLVGLAAAVILAVGLGWIVFQQGPSGPQQLALQQTDFSIEVDGLASTRSVESVQPVAYPDTQVTVSVVAERSATGGLNYGLYRMDEGRMTRLDESAIETSVFRGAVEFTGIARELVGDRAGTHRLLVGVSSGSLPEMIVFSAEEEIAATFESTTGGVALWTELNILEKSQKE